VEKKMATPLRCKVAIVGPCKSGKTSLAYVFHGKPFPKAYNMTPAVEYFVSPMKLAERNDYKIELHILDTSGHPIYAKQKVALLTDLSAIIAVYDIAVPGSLDEARIMLDEAIRASKTKTENIIGVLVANKSDLEDVAEITQEQGEAAASEAGVKFFSVSVLHGTNVEAPFSYIANEFLRQYEAHVKAFQQAF